jgi:Flp pilus assembly protein TadD
MRAHALLLVLLLAAGCATPEEPAPAPTPAPAADTERETRIQQAAALKLQGRTLAIQKRRGQAIALLQRSAALNPADPETHSLLGTVLLEAGRFPLAALSFERAHTLEPDDPRVDAGLGTAYSMMGRYEEAKAPLLRASRAFPENYALLLHLGRAANVTKDFRLCAESFRTFTRAIEKRDPALVPEDIKHDYQKALTFAELCEQQADERKAVEYEAVGEQPR